MHQLDQPLSRSCVRVCLCVPTIWERVCMWVFYRGNCELEWKDSIDFTFFIDICICCLSFSFLHMPTFIFLPLTFLTLRRNLAPDAFERSFSYSCWLLPLYFSSSLSLAHWLTHTLTHAETSMVLYQSQCRSIRSLRSDLHSIASRLRRNDCPLYTQSLQCLWMSFSY